MSGYYVGQYNNCLDWKTRRQIQYNINKTFGDAKFLTAS